MTGSLARPWPWPAPEDDGGAKHLAVGLPLPDVPLPSTLGDRVTLAALPGRSILFIYPWTGSPGRPNPLGWDDIPGAHGSTAEVEGFQDAHASFERVGIRVFGLSRQSTADQTAFAGRLGLPFPLLSDAQGHFSTALNLPSFEIDGTMYLKRLTLVVDSGRIARIIYPVHPPDRHAAEMLASLAPTSTA